MSKRASSAGAGPSGGASLSSVERQFRDLLDSTRGAIENNRSNRFSQQLIRIRDFKKKAELAIGKQKSGSNTESELAALEAELSTILDRANGLELVKEAAACEALFKKREEIEKSLFA